MVAREFVSLMAAPMIVTALRAALPTIALPMPSEWRARMLVYLVGAAIATDMLVCGDTVRACKRGCGGGGARPALRRSMRRGILNRLRTGMPGP